MEMIAATLARARAEGVGLEDIASRLVAEARAAGNRLPGFGHRVHRIDPRTGTLFAMARNGGLAGDGIRVMEALEEALSRAVKPLPINIDGALAAVLHDMGFSPPFGRLVFLIGRTAGLSAEVAEELAREKPMRIRIPVEYDGDGPRSLD
jgi:citrate synthase